MPGIARHTPILAGTKVVRAVSFDTALLPHVGDALHELVETFSWVEVGDPVEDIVSASLELLEIWYSNMLIGSVSLFLVTPPSGWLLLDGSTYAQADYPLLSALLDASLKSGSNFTLPDVNAAFCYGVDDKADAGLVEGDNVLNLTVAQMPAHTHNYTPPVLTIDAETPTVPIPTAAIGAPIATSSTGSGDDIDKRPLHFGLVYAVYAGQD